MMNLIGMGVFARVAEAKSFSGAARRLGMSKSLVSKEVSKLEKALGARLLNRTTRQLSLTELGTAYYEYCARILQEAEDAELLVDRLHASPRGVLKCTAPVAFATLHIARALPEFLAQYPEVHVDLTVGDRFFELAEEGYDLAIRIARDLPPNMVARSIAPINRVVCGTPRYFADHGVPKTPEELSSHNCVLYTHANPDSTWHLSANGVDIAVPVGGTLKVNDDEVAWRAVRAGLGVSLLSTFIVGDDLQSGRLQAVLTEYLPSERNLYALYLPNRHLSAKVRVFIDFLLSKFAAPPYWDRNWMSASAMRPGEARQHRARAKGSDIAWRRRTPWFGVNPLQARSKSASDVRRGAAAVLWSFRACRLRGTLAAGRRDRRRHDLIMRRLSAPPRGWEGRAWARRRPAHAAAACARVRGPMETVLFECDRLSRFAHPATMLVSSHWIRWKGIAMHEAAHLPATRSASRLRADYAARPSDPQFNTRSRVADIGIAAERARALDGVAAGSLEEYRALTRLKEDPARRYDARGDEGTTDFLTGLMQAHGKMPWMLHTCLR